MTDCDWEHTFLGVTEPTAVTEPTTAPFCDWERALIAREWCDWRFRWCYRWCGLRLAVTLPIQAGWRAFWDAHKALARMRRREGQEIRNKWQ